MHSMQGDYICERVKLRKIVAIRMHTAQMKTKKNKMRCKLLFLLIFILHPVLIFSKNKPIVKKKSHSCGGQCESDFFILKNTAQRKSKGIKIVVIDAGHGGKDPGCMGTIHKEKEVTLGVALKLGKLIEENLKDVKVIYTRKTDVFVELEERAQIANRNDADLFISIHCNAAATTVTYKDKNGKTRKKEVLNPKPFGSETYVMGIKNERGNMEVAKRENAVMLLEENYKKTYNGFDPNSDEAYIIMSIFTGAFVEQSAIFASKIQTEYAKKAGRIDKGVHRQSIWVLWRTAMPSILTEVGFLTNPEEEKFLGSDKGQRYLSTALFRALRNYKNEVEGIKISYNDEFENEIPLENENKGITSENQNQNNLPDTTKNQGNDNIKSETLTKSKIELLLAEGDKLMHEGKYKEALQNYRLVIEQNNNNPDVQIKITDAEKKLTAALESDKAKNKAEEENTALFKKLIKEGDEFFNSGKFPESKKKYIEALNHKPGEKYPKMKIDEIDDKLREEKTVNASELIEKYKAKENTSGNKTEKKDQTEYKIQFTSSESELNLKEEKYRKLEPISFYKVGTVLKYTSGIFKDMKDAQLHQKKVREMGFKDAFIVLFKNGERVVNTKN